MFAILALIPRWGYEVLGAAALVAAIFFAGEHRVRVVEHEKIVKQEVQVEKRIVETDHTHDQELADLRAYHDAHPTQPVRMCLSQPVRPASAERLPGTPAGDVQQVPSGDSGSGVGAAGPDIGPLLGLLALRGDEVSATLRRRQSLEP